MITEFDLGRVGHDPLAMSRSSWSEALAEQRARESGIGELSDDHWRLIRSLRDHFVQYGGPPPERYACLNARLEGRCVQRLFGGMQQARRVAGIPAPGEGE